MENLQEATTMECPTEFKTRIDFTLPKGSLDEETGILHRRGVMRLATAADEILPLRDPRVQQNEAYLPIIILARVIVRLGDLQTVDTRVIEKLFASDFEFLQRLYETLNRADDDEADQADNGIGALERASNAARRLRTVGEA